MPWCTPCELSTEGECRPAGRRRQAGAGALVSGREGALHRRRNCDTYRGWRRAAAGGPSDGGWRWRDDGGTDGRHERARSLRDRQRHDREGLRRADRPGAGHRHHLPLRPRHHARHPRGLRPQPAGDDPGLSRHGEVDAHRAGGGAAELALRAGEPQFTHQPHRPDRQGRDQDPRRAAGDRVPGGDPALVPAGTRWRSASTSTTPGGRT